MSTWEIKQISNFKLQSFPHIFTLMLIYTYIEVFIGKYIFNFL